MRMPSPPPTSLSPPPTGAGREPNKTGVRLWTAPRGGTAQNFFIRHPLDISQSATANRRFRRSLLPAGRGRVFPLRGVLSYSLFLPVRFDWNSSALPTIR